MVISRTIPDSAAIENFLIDFSLWKNSITLCPAGDRPRNSAETLAPTAPTRLSKISLTLYIK